MASWLRKPREIFLSHASADFRIALAISAGLKELGVNVWYAPAKLRGADARHDEIGKALQRCDTFVLLLSPAAVKSDWVRHEFVFAISQSRYRRRIVPVLIKRCRPEKLSWVLSNIQQINCVRRPAAAAPKIADVWRA